MGLVLQNLTLLILFELGLGLPEGFAAGENPIRFQDKEWRSSREGY
jgi:hypothetical protein